MESLRDDFRADPWDGPDQILELKRFTPHLGEMFDVCMPEGSFQIQLVEAKALPGNAGTNFDDAFSLVFRADKECSLNDGPVAMEHETVGWVVLFLVAMGEHRDGRYFEAIIS